MPHAQGHRLRRPVRVPARGRVRPGEPGRCLRAHAPGIADQLGVSISTVRRLLDADASLEELGGVPRGDPASSDLVGPPPRGLLGPLLDPGRRGPLPADEWSAVTELSWWRLLVDATSSVSADVSHDTSLSLRDQFESRTATSDPHGPPVPARRRPDPALADRVADRGGEVVAPSLRPGPLALLAVPEGERGDERPTLRALVDGLTLAICVHGLSHDSRPQGPRVTPGPAGPPPPAPGSRWLGWLRESTPCPSSRRSPTAGDPAARRDEDIEAAIAGHDEEIAHWFGFPEVTPPTTGTSRRSTGGGRRTGDGRRW